MFCQKPVKYVTIDIYILKVALFEKIYGIEKIEKKKVSRHY